ncbi:MAG: glycerophosphodiester phosphodiesterase family protein [bacterium]
MKKTTLLPLIGVSAAAAAVWMLAPGRAPAKKKAPFLRRNFAHRGLHEADQSVPENSLAAFRRAAEAGYGMELDVQLSRDGEVMVFHDDDLLRATGVGLAVAELSYRELRSLRLFGTEEKIPTLAEVLHLVNGRAPLIVELKTGRSNRALCRKTLALLRNYTGEVCIESFDPAIVAWFRFHAPRLLRGQLTQQTAAYGWYGAKRLGAALLANGFLNFLARPEFIACRLGKKPLGVRFAEALGALRFCWTSHGPAAERENDAVIFEYYRPERSF